MELCQVRDQYIRWLQAARNLSPHTIRAYSGDIAALVRFLGDHGTLSCVDPTHLLAFVEAERAAGLTPRSLRRRTAGIRGFCRWLVSADLLDEDPWTGLTVRLGSPPRLPRALPRHDLDHLLAALRDAAALGGCSIPDEALARPHPTTTLLAVVLMVAAGLRVSEVVGLRQQDIDLPRRSLRITGKGLRERYVFLTNDWVASLVTAYLTTRAALRIGHDRLLFNHHRAPLTPASMRSRL